MERVSHKFCFLLLAIAFEGSFAWAGTFLLPPPPPREAGLPPSEAYPESRFGHEPSRMRDDGPYFSPIGDEVASRAPASVGAAGPGGAGAGPGAELDPAVTRKGVQEVALIASDLGYFPKTIFVTRDIPVRLFVTGSSKNTLCIMMDSFAVRKQVRSQRVEEIQFVPNQPGMYRFYCPVNGMEGTLVVKDLSSN